MTPLKKWSGQHARTLSWVALAVAIFTAIYAVFTLVGVSAEQRRVDQSLVQANQRVDSLKTGVDANAQALRKANERLVAAGKPTVPVPAPSPSAGPQGPVGTAGTQGVPGPGPSTAQVRAAVQTVLANNPGYTRSQVVTAVVDYLSTNPPPAGTNGSNGADGQPGQSGSPGKDGKDGANATPAQIAAAVASYCVDNNSCQGEKGEQGERGEPGAPGRGISSVTCNGITPQSFTINYSDGTSETIECKMEGST